MVKRKTKKKNKVKPGVWISIILAVIIIGFVVTQTGQFAITGTNQDMQLSFTKGVEYDIAGNSFKMVTGSPEFISTTSRSTPKHVIRQDGDCYQLSSQYVIKYDLLLNGQSESWVSVKPALSSDMCGACFGNEPMLCNVQGRNVGNEIFENIKITSVRNQQFSVQGYGRSDGTPTSQVTNSGVFSFRLARQNYPISTDAVTVLFTNQNYEMPITLESFTDGEGFIDLEYSFENSIFPAAKVRHNFSFSKGENQITVPVPTQTEAKMVVEARAGIYINVNEDHERYFTQTMEHFFLINPKPLWVDKDNCGTNCNECSGYEISPSDKYCIQEEISEISCLQTGCPVVEGHNYMCMSDGFCSELIYIFINQTVFVNQTVEVETEVLRECETDVQCQALGGVCGENANGDRFCVNEIVTEVIREEQIEIPTPVFVSQTCDDFDFCDETQGYKCVDKDFSGDTVAICERTVDVTKEQVPSYIILIIIIAIVVIIVLSAIALRKKK